MDLVALPWASSTLQTDIHVNEDINHVLQDRDRNGGRVRVATRVGRDQHSKPIATRCPYLVSRGC